MKKICLIAISLFLSWYASPAQNNSHGDHGDTGLSHLQAPPPGNLYILNQAFPPQPNSSFYITGMGTIGGGPDVDHPLTVFSSSRSRTSILFSNTNNPNSNWMLDISNSGKLTPGTLSMVNLLKNTTALSAFPNGRVGINGVESPVAALDVNGDLHASGNIMLGMFYQQKDSSMKKGYAMLTLDCPAGYQVVSGGGGGRDLNGALKDVHVAFSGPDEDTPYTRWRVLLYNSSSSSRAVRVTCTCARIK